MLRKIRIAFAVLFFILLTLLLLDFSGTLHVWVGWMVKAQFLPALLALNAVVIAILVVATLLFGRIYCSVVCPLGVMQDVVSYVAAKRRKNRFKFSPARNYLRYGVLVLFLAAFAAGIGSIVALLEPYSAYGRIVTNLISPLYLWGNNLLAVLAERVDSYAFYSVEVWMRGAATLAVAVVTLLVVGILAWRHGRAYCNTICPVGTLLGLFSHFSLCKPRIDTSKCNGCKLCARNCKSSCIDPEHHRIDYSRCVACMDCLGNCRQGAISYTLCAPKPAPATPVVSAAAKTKPAPTSSAAKSETPADASRRNFLSVVGLFALTATVKAQEKKVDGGLALIQQKRVPERQTPLTPAGAQGGWHMARHCTGCQLCISACPNHVLHPSAHLMTLMQPEMSYERGYCRPECTSCSEVCPTGAIHPITVADKSAIQIGHAVWIADNCVVARDGVQCNNCARHCPVGAIKMVLRDTSDSNSLRIPAVNEERCIGCGACENLCPARPFSAIYVEGHERHRVI